MPVIHLMQAVHVSIDADQVGRAQIRVSAQPVLVMVPVLDSGQKVSLAHIFDLAGLCERPHLYAHHEHGGDDRNDTEGDHVPDIAFRHIRCLETDNNHTEYRNSGNDHG